MADVHVITIPCVPNTVNKLIQSHVFFAKFVFPLTTLYAGSLFAIKLISYSLCFIFTFAVNVTNIRVLTAHSRISVLQVIMLIKYED